MPVSEGLAYPSTAQRLPYGCHHLAQHLLQQLSARGLIVSSLSSSGSSGSSSSSSSSGGGAVTYADPAAVALDSLARSVACIAASGDAAGLAAAAGQPTTHTLPDGQQITIEREGAQLGEALMDGSLLGADVARLSEAIWTVATAHTDQASRKVRWAGSQAAQQHLVGNICWCGFAGVALHTSCWHGCQCICALHFLLGPPAHLPCAPPAGPLSPRSCGWKA